MPTIAKVIAGLVAAVVAGLAAVAVAAVWLIDPNDYRDDIAKQVEASTGRSFAIEGELDLSIFPWIAVEVNDSRLSDDPAFSDQAMAEIEQLSIRLKLLPLLKREIQVGRVLLNGLTLRLAVNEEGAGNWESLVAAENGETSPEEANTEAAAGDGQLPVTSVQVEGLSISNALIHYEDRQAGSSYRLEDFRLESDRITLEEPFQLEGGAGVKLSAPDMAAVLSWQTQISVDLEQSQFRLQDLVVEAEVEGEGIKRSLPLKLQADVFLDTNQESLEVSELIVSSDSLKLQSTASVNNWSNEGELDATLALSPWDAREWLQRLDMTLPEMSDSEALSNVSAQLTAEGSLSRITVSPLTITLDGSSMTGDALLNLQSEVPDVQLTLAVDELNLDRYMASATEEDSDEGTAASDEAAGEDINATEVDLSALNSANASADLSIGRLQASRVVTENVDLKLRLKDGTLRLAPLSLNLYSGSLRTEGTLADSRNGANIQLKTQLTALQLGPLTEALMEKPTLSGLGNVSFNFNSKGKTFGQLRQALNGTLSFDLADGAVYGFNVAKILRSAQARRSGDPMAVEQAQQEQQTDFAALSATAVIENGVLRNQDLSMMSPALRLAGEGLVDLFKEQIDYRSTVAIVDTTKGQAGESLDELKGLKVPVIVGGSFSQPSVRVDIAGALKAAAEAKYGAKVEAEKAEAKAKIEDKKQELRDKAAEKLNRLFTR